MKKIIISCLVIGILFTSGCVYTDVNGLTEEDMKSSIDRFCKDNGFDEGDFSAGSILTPHVACCFMMNGSVVLEERRIFGEGFDDYKIYDEECP